MAEIYPIEDVLDKIKEFTPLQRILLASAGTNQSTLSAYFGSPVTIRVTDQRQDRDAHIRRETDLICDDTIVCSAKTTIITHSKTVRKLLEDQELGIGQIMQCLGIKPGFQLQHVGIDDFLFWRTYSLWGKGEGFLDVLTYRIREQFPLELYRE